MKITSPINITSQSKDMKTAPCPIASRKTFGLRRANREVRELIYWINEQEFTHFITLATNSSDLRSADPRLLAGLQGIDRLRGLARHWDGHMNRALLGSKWSATRHRDARMFAMYFPEKLATNPHWHVLVRINEKDADKYARKIQTLETQTDSKWRSLIRSGSTRVKTIYDEGASNYVGKSLSDDVSYQNVILPGQFGTH